MKSSTNGKIAILTLVSYNQGNRLQNYALQTVLEKMGYEVETLRRVNVSLIKSIKRQIRNIVKKDQYTCFNKFNHLIKWSKDVVSDKHTSENIAHHYDYFIIGSDQIWNPKIDACTASVYLPDVPSNKKIAYAASFGTTEFSKAEIDKMIPLLNDIGKISCREETGTAFVNDCTANHGITVVDPVMLLTREEWEHFEVRPAFLKCEKYILRYILGNYKYEEHVRELSAQLCAEVIEPWGGHLVDPREFLYLIHHAEYIFTDSFHGAVFSIIFGKNFTVAERIDEKENMTCRLDSLCKMFGMEYMRDNEQAEVVRNFSKEKLEEIEKILKLRREEAMEYLKLALSQEKEI